MKLFLIIYAMGKIGGFAGPLPYDMKECEARRDEFRHESAVIIETGRNSAGDPIPEENRRQIKTMTFECEKRDSKPVLGESAT